MGNYESPINLMIVAAAKHSAKPHIAGTANETNVHLRLFVSFFIVSSVVEHGQCMSMNSSVQTAVVIVHPFAIKSERSSERLESSISVPVAA